MYKSEVTRGFFNSEVEVLIPTFLLLFSIFPIGILRMYILIGGIFHFKRFPIFKDGIEYLPTVFSRNTDEWLLVWAHFIIPIIIITWIIAAISFFKKLQKRELILGIIAIIFEIGFRMADFYEYVLFD